ncbi:MAG: methyltransferase [Ginsengibacter sp.]
MRNTYFQFKEFTVHQHKSGMKVCTDSCLFGAWIAYKIALSSSENSSHIGPEKILDIGTGTGLISLMLAQKSTAQIQAVEIEVNAFEQAKENFISSTWADRLKAIHSDIKEFNPAEKFDLIISNPPFFEHDLKSAAHHKNLAKHHDGLLLKDLLISIENLLAGNGKFALLIPFHRDAEVISLAEKQGFFLEERILVKQTPRHNYFRVMHLFSREKKDIISAEITIKNEEDLYSEEFQFLLRDYYLRV